MKFSTAIVSALAAVVSAAPTKEVAPRGIFDASQFNNFQFNNLDLNYLSVVNGLDFNILQQLASVNNFNINGFQNVFAGNVFDINALLQLQQIQQLIQLQQLGVLGGFDLSTLALNNVNFGLINAVGGIDLTQFIDSSLIPQIQTIVQQQVTTVIKE
ncbi:hypothetical protein JX265_000264 [Neoarthrinium moseri]|uniref:Uncharacterized protein n=1 Tax=Neoarthrinium moseri TaxID=1658444 RepID=A0A9P9WY55_9PEZI|nr:uncharacterized protein JN550_001036 [Neoarthrinium moseri]KAI1853237.1 hypothetical protein JX266_001943 [Neoarthrinium moseri]KAI1876964.1 hypothetical protein JN550_001036 [Neoarthrinium moseri]KAI1881438.1 hypothetical protein JX265_000264 [Neoarthrinium moseri]